MKKIILILLTIINLFADDVVVFNNEYKVLELDKKVTKLLIGNQEMINVSILSTSRSKKTTLKIFGKKSGNTSILIKYRDGSLQNYHVYINENLGFIQKMINMIEPTLELSKVGDGSTVITGSFKDPHNKRRIYTILENGGIDVTKLMDLTTTTKVNKMVRTKLYLVEINNQKAKDLGGVTGMGFFSEYLSVAVNPGAANSATFSGFLLDNTGSFTAQKGNSVSGTLNFLQESGIGTILDDTVLMTTEDENASFRVGGDVYIPIGVTQNIGGLAPTIQLEEKKYGLFLNLNSQFMEKEGFIHINVDIKDSEFDTNKDHDVQLGEYIIVPSFISKDINTNVVVKSGQVIVLGGRLHTEEVEREEKVPFLGDIPWLGELFTHTVSGTKENDLLFFLVPEIIDANDNIDDTFFYQEFKDESNKFHKKAYSLDDRKEQEEVAKVEKVSVTEVDEEVVIIEVEEHKSNLEKGSNKAVAIKEVAVKKESKPQEVSVYDEVLNQEKIPEVKKQKVAKKIVNPDTKVATIEKSSAPIVQYEVTRNKTFLRSRPVDGRRDKVWIQGHKFTISDKKVIDGVTWMKIKENCFKECVPETKELWISENVSKKV